MDKEMHYLRLARIQREIRKLEAQGYKITVPKGGPDLGYDFLAENQKERLVFQVKAPGGLPTKKEQYAEQRQKIVEQGFDDVRIIVVQPPRDISIEVYNLEHILFEHMVNSAEPVDLSELPGWASLRDINGIEIHYVSIDKEGIHVTGDASADVEIEVAGGEERDGATWTDSFPLEFDIVLNHDMTIESVHSLEIDTSSFYGDQEDL